MRATDMIAFLNVRKTWPYYTSYRNVPAMQWPEVLQGLDALDSALEPKPRQIVELGTARGGMTRILRDHDLGARAVIDTFDILDAVTPDDRAYQVLYHHGDVFFELFGRVCEILARDWQTVLLCDGGNKPAEVRSFAHRLKVGDVVCVHDFEGRLGSFGWPWVECRWENVADALVGFEPFAEEAMARAAWGCFQKVK